MSSDLAALPRVRFVDGDAADVERNVITGYERLSGRSLAKGDPVRLFLESVAAVIVQQRELIDWAAKQNLLAYASGNYLDHLGALLGVTRLPARAAVCTVRFALSAPQTFAVLIPKGTRVSPDGALAFATDEVAVIYAGDTSTEATVTCLESGAAGNGYAAGKIDRIVDPIAYVASVVNVTASLGGSDAESDDSLRERIHLAPESFSVAGSSGAYEYWAKTAHQNVVDVSVIGPEDEPGNVYVYPLLADGGIPSSDILDLVSGVLNGEKVRPLSDRVFVKAPEAVTYRTELTYYVARSRAAAAGAIREAVERAVAEYESWQRSKLGRDVNPSELILRVMAAGVLRVEVTSPVHAVLTPSQVAIVSAESVVNFGGFEDG
ncbi:MAG: baseplate J/gp47 family protein [Pyramidobacter porci]|uniref:baseplate assembly protein n=1 Tax=Pyramidobacter porci TaxID=2605789 RepID=UPI002A75D86F|nr:baseplate J/gp47 family protein [Pyramidobacter porci]MDY2647920.1 baseplate J/gp47 family protein [Pyramidobacter porci]